VRKRTAASLVIVGGAILIGVATWWALLPRLRFKKETARVYLGTLNGSPFLFNLGVDRGQAYLQSPDPSEGSWERSPDGFQLVQVTGDLAPARYGEIPRFINRHTNMLGRLELDARHVPRRLSGTDGALPTTPTCVAHLHSAREDFGAKLGPLGLHSGYTAKFPQLDTSAAGNLLGPAVNRRLLVLVAEFSRQQGRQHRAWSEKHSWLFPSEFNMFDLDHQFVLTHCAADLIMLDRQEMEYTYATTPSVVHRPFIFVRWQGSPNEVDCAALWDVLTASGEKYRKQSRPAREYEISPLGMTTARFDKNGWRFEGVKGPYSSSTIETFDLSRVELGNLIRTHEKRLLKRLDAGTGDKPTTP
jgi:hypothetical protein